MKYVLMTTILLGLSNCGPSVPLDDCHVSYFDSYAEAQRKKNCLRVDGASKPPAVSAARTQSDGEGSQGTKNPTGGGGSIGGGGTTTVGVTPPTGGGIGAPTPGIGGAPVNPPGFGGIQPPSKDTSDDEDEYEDEVEEDEDDTPEPPKWGGGS